MITDRFVTASEYQVLPIGEAREGITPAEAEQLDRLGMERAGFFRRGYRSVVLKQYCGVASMGARVLEILPKIYDTESEEEGRSFLLGLLAHAHDFPTFRDRPAAQSLRDAPLLEVFISAFFDAMTEIVRGGLLRQYREHDEDLAVIRGRIALARQFGRYGGRHDVAACLFDELTADNQWNRLLKAGLRAVRPWIVSSQLHRRWSELMMVLDEVADVELHRAVFRRLVFDRHGVRYRTAVEWVRWIAATLSPAVRAGESAAPGLLFDMNQLFESATTAMLRRRAPEYVDVVAQPTEKRLASLPHRSEFTIRPDLLLRTPAGIAIGDTKWKKLELAFDGYLRPDLDDVYQMLAYAAAYNCDDLTLIYPWHSGLTASHETRLQLPAVGSVRPTLTVVCVNWQNGRFVTKRGVASPFGSILV